MENSEKIVVTEDNFTQLIADADDWVTLVNKQLGTQDKEELIHIGDGIDHVQKLLAIIDFLIS